MDNGVLSILEAPRESASISTNAPPIKSTGRLFSATQVAVATLLGSPLAGAALFARNYQVLGKHRAALLWLGLGIIGTVLLLVIAVMLPKGTPTFLSVLSIVGMRQAVNHFQGRAISDHTYAGGAQGSWFVAIAVGVAGLVCVLGAVFVLVFVLLAVSSIQS